MDRLDEVAISRAIIEEYTREFSGCLESDVAVVGAGPAGMVAGYFHARAGRKGASCERRLAGGGGMWGGGILYGR